MAADIYVDKKYVIHIDGDIKSGDSEKVAFIAGKMTFINAFAVNSPGGSVVESIRIASLIEGTHAKFYVEKGGICASACFFMLIAAQQRLFSSFTGDARRNPTPEEIAKHRFVGIHRPFLGSKNEKKKSSAEKQEKLMGVVRNYLKNKQIPQYLIDQMMGRSSNEIYWLREEDANLLGEYSPGYEEVIIKECGYNKMNIDNTWSKDRVGRFIECELDVWDREYRKSQNLFLLKLDVGWRPWLE